MRSQVHEAGRSSPSTTMTAVSPAATWAAAGRVNCVVVYKVDRLSRSLLDFARMMETFEKYKVSFVSVTVEGAFLPLPTPAMHQTRQAHDTPGHNRQRLRYGFRWCRKTGDAKTGIDDVIGWKGGAPGRRRQEQGVVFPVAATEAASRQIRG
ncbi:MAG: recombinase family protein [Planctomycetaceae bacterium]